VLQEGLVGRLQIRKSGRCQLILGSQIMDVEVGTKVGFLQVRHQVLLDEENVSRDNYILRSINTISISSSNLEPLFVFKFMYLS
jgi:hypothetical protein